MISNNKLSIDFYLQNVVLSCYVMVLLDQEDIVLVCHWGCWLVHK